MPQDNESPRSSAQPWSPPEPGTLMNMMLEAPETLLLAWQQMLAGAPALPASWGAQWRQVPGGKPGAPWEGTFQVQAPAERSEPSTHPPAQVQVQLLDFWRRTMRSFRHGLAAPPKGQ